MRTYRLVLSSAAAIAVLLGSVAHGAIYYINDGPGTNAAGSTFVTSSGWSYVKQPYHTSYGTDYTYSGGGAATGTFTFQGIPTAEYYVYAGWSPPANPASRTQNGTITVNGPGGSLVAYPVNHEKRANGSAGSDYSGSGFFPVTATEVQQPITLGSGSTIVYTDGKETPDGDKISADVVVISTDLIIDDVGPFASGTNYNLNWNQYGNVLGEYSYGYHTTTSENPPSSHVFTYDLGTALGGEALKDLKVSWIAASGRDDDVTYRVTHADGVTDVTVNQRQYASGTLVSGSDVVWSDFRSLGAFYFDANSKLEVIPDGSHRIAADTIMLGHVEPMTPPTIVANFDGGNGSAHWDGYPGTAGPGWVAGWSTTSSGTTATVDTANPIEDAGDPYVVVSATGNADHGIRRQYQKYGSANPAHHHIISWKWRFDGDINQMTTFNDRIHFFGNDAPKTGTDATASWLISYTPDGGTNTVPEGEWWFFDSKKSGSYSGSYNIANMVPTGIGLEADVVYTFEVELFPETGTYNATIWSDDESFFAENLTFRNGETGAFDWLHFGGHSTGGEYWKFAFDSLAIHVPEPGTLLLLSAGLLVGLLRRRRQ